MVQLLRYGRPGSFTPFTPRSEIDDHVGLAGPLIVRCESLRYVWSLPHEDWIVRIAAMSIYLTVDGLIRWEN